MYSLTCRENGVIGACRNRKFQDFRFSGKKRNFSAISCAFAIGGISAILIFCVTKIYLCRAVRATMYGVGMMNSLMQGYFPGVMPGCGVGGGIAGVMPACVPGVMPGAMPSGMLGSGACGSGMTPGVCQENNNQCTLGCGAGQVHKTERETTGERGVGRGGGAGPGA